MNKKPDTSYVYVIVRTDLPGPQITVQAGHALIAATNAYGAPLRTHPHLVLCAVADEAALTDAFERLKVAGVAVCAYYEDDLDNALTAIATGLLRGAERAPLRHFRLLR